MGFKKAPSIKHLYGGKYPMSNADIVHACTKFPKSKYALGKHDQLVQIIGSYEDKFVGHYMHTFNHVFERDELKQLTVSDRHHYNTVACFRVVGVTLKFNITEESCKLWD